MTDKQITALAREYAVEKGKELEEQGELPCCLIKEIVEMDVKGLGLFMVWLTRRYCLVEKAKFKVGDKVIFKNTGKPKIVVNIAEDGRYVVTSPDGKSPYRVYESDLEPYINPGKVSRNLSQETANCDKQLDNSLSDSATHANVATSSPNVATSSHNVATSSHNVATSAPNIATSAPNVATSATRLRLRVATKIAAAIAPVWADTPGAGSLIAKCRQLARVSATLARALITECSKETDGDDD